MRRPGAQQQCACARELERELETRERIRRVKRDVGVPSGEDAEEAGEREGALDANGDGGARIRLEPALQKRVLDGVEERSKPRKRHCGSSLL